MSEPLKLGRYSILLDVLSRQNDGCTIKQLFNLARIKHPDLWTNEMMVRRDLDDLVAVGWVATSQGGARGRFYCISAVLGEYYFRRFLYCSEQARKPLLEMRDMYERMHGRVNDLCREVTHD